MTSNLEKRLLSKSKKEGDCLIWTGSRDSRGYGKFWVGLSKKYMGAHRVSYIVHKGGIPEGMYVCHSCDVPLCINPDHLFLGTPKDNTDDMIKKGRSKTIGSEYQKGDKNGNAKLTLEKVKSIRAGRSQGGTLKELSQKYNVHLATIGLICQGKIWRDE